MCKCKAFIPGGCQGNRIYKKARRIYMVIDGKTLSGIADPRCQRGAYGISS
jgi:hypothetical protein